MLKILKIRLRTFFEAVLIIAIHSDRPNNKEHKSKRPALLCYVFRREDSVNGSYFTESAGKEGCVDILFEILIILIFSKAYNFQSQSLADENFKVILAR